ncbi:13356_t:CDS:2, partial [Cetraspora pellucida]
MVNSFLITWNSTNQPIFIYRPTARIWVTYDPITTIGAPTIRRRSTSTVIVNGVIYIFGGRAQIDTGSPTFICFNDLFTYDTILSRWGKINAANVPTPRSHSAAVLLPDGRILYIGGISQTSPGEPGMPIDMKEIQVFDTASSSWSSKQAVFESSFIQPRAGHTANLAPDNKSIIIIGGTSSYVLNETTAKPVMVLLDISKEPYTYSELNERHQRNRPIGRDQCAHLHTGYEFTMHNLDKQFQLIGIILSYVLKRSKKWKWDWNYFLTPRIPRQTCFLFVESLIVIEA